MGDSIFQRSVLSSVIVAGGFAAIFFLSGFLDENRLQLPPEYADSDLSFSGSRLRGFTFGMDGLLADWYYMRALQYVGDKILNSKSDVINMDDLRDLDPRLLYPFLDNATDLDPHFLDAYLYGAIVLPAIDAEQAIAISKKGISHNPDEWRLYRPLGYNYWKLGRYDEAAAVYEKAAELPGAPAFMGLMAAAMKTKGGSRETARAIYREMFNSSDDQAIKITAQRRLAELDYLDDSEAVDKALSEFREKNGQCPNTIAEIMPQLSKTELPEHRDLAVDKARNLIDPWGTPYILDREKCVVKTSHTVAAIP